MTGEDEQTGSRAQTSEAESLLFGPRAIVSSKAPPARVHLHQHVFAHLKVPRTASDAQRPGILAAY